MVRHITNRLSLPAVCTIASGVVLAGQVTVWATTACQVPNPSTVFCSGNPQPFNCGEQGESSCERRWDAVDRNKFPDGGVSSASGTTTEEEAPCNCAHYCVWDDMAETCGSCEDCCDEDDPNWEPADKTVVGENECPTEEDT